MGFADEDEEGKVGVLHVDVTRLFLVTAVGKVPAEGTALAEKLVLPQPQGYPVRQRVVKGHGWCFMAELQECMALGGRSIPNHGIICAGRDPQE